MGEVYRAKDTKLGREVAVKVLPGDLFEDRESVARFERGAKSLAAVSHPNIAALYASEEISGRASFSSWSWSRDRRSPSGSRRDPWRWISS